MTTPNEELPVYDEKAEMAQLPEYEARDAESTDKSSPESSEDPEALNDAEVAAERRKTRVGRAIHMMFGVFLLMSLARVVIAIVAFPAIAVPHMPFPGCSKAGPRGPHGPHGPPGPHGLPGPHDMGHHGMHGMGHHGSSAEDMAKLHQIAVADHEAAVAAHGRHPVVVVDSLPSNIEEGAVDVVQIQIEEPVENAENVENVETSEGEKKTDEVTEEEKPVEEVSAPVSDAADKEKDEKDVKEASTSMLASSRAEVSEMVSSSGEKSQEVPEEIRQSVEGLYNIVPKEKIEEITIGPLGLAVKVKDVTNEQVKEMYKYLAAHFREFAVIRD